MRAFSSASHLRPTRDADTSGVSTFLKIMLVLLLTLPLGAYITGTLVASQADMPAERVPVVIEEEPEKSSATPSRSAEPSAKPSAKPRPTKRPQPTPPDREDSDDRDDEDVKVVRPTPRDVDDDHDDDRDDDDRHDDDSDDSDD